MLLILLSSLKDDCKLEPKRADKDNEGHLLNSEIADFIKRAKIIIADLTNERPNCYLEVGYAMGINKFSNLILCAREDYNPDNLKYKPGGPKVHFDVSGYDILWWDKDKLDEFRESLIKKIKHRLSIVNRNAVDAIPLENRQEEQISDKEKELLVSANANKGELYLMEAGGTEWIEIQGAKNFYNINDPAYAELYIEAFNSLIEKGYIRNVSGLLYKLTGSGFTLARKLANE